MEGKKERRKKMEGEDRAKERGGVKPEGNQGMLTGGLNANP